MDVRPLETFPAVVDHRAVMQAPPAIHVTLSPISAQIAHLEQELSVLLLDHGNGRPTPTAEGILLCAEADTVLSGMGRLSEVARRNPTAQAGRRIIAGHPSAAISVLHTLISAFVAEEPGVNVWLLSRNSDVIGRLLAGESYDFGIAELPVDDAVVRPTHFRVRCVAMLPANHPSACYSTLSPPRLSGQATLAQARTRSAPVAHAFTEAAAEWLPVTEAEYFTSVCGFVADEAGWSAVHPVSASTFRYMGLVARSFEPASDCAIGAFCTRHREPSILAQSLLSMRIDKLGPLYA